MDTKESKGIWLYLFLAVSALLVLVLVLVVVFILLDGGNGNGPRKEAELPPTATLTSTPEPAPTIISEPGVLRRIESTMVLQTTVFRIDTVVRAKKEGGFLNLGAENLLLFVKGTVTAGVDLSELDEDNIEISHETKTITITLPQAKVLNPTLDDYQVETYKGEEPKKVDYTLLIEGLDAGRKQIGETACESGILERATEDARRAYEEIMSFVELMDYQVTVKSSPVPECSMEVQSSVALPALPEEGN